MTTPATTLKYFILFVLSFMLTSCSSAAKIEEEEDKDKEEPVITDINIIYLHHSTGEVIWNGKGNTNLPELFRQYNRDNNTSYSIKDQNFPQASPYGWNNYPYDYWNIWVKNAGVKPYMEEPTLEILTKEYQVIIFKHCFPVSDIEANDNNPRIDSHKQTLANYKLQYEALKTKLLEFPDTKFILYTGAAQVEGATTEAMARRAKEFFEWVKNEWDIAGDNIYLWDFQSLETEGGLYLKNNYAVSPYDSHPNSNFAGQVVTLLFNRIIDVINNNGGKTDLTGKKLP